jgi:alpha-glucosidase (family GH31 glycosyl hydrolase)
LLNTPFRSVFALCSEAEDVARIESWEGRVELHLFHEATLKEVLWRLTDHLGRPALPPAFAFAPWLDALYGSDNVRRVADKLREEGVPSSVIWTEDWRGGEFDAIGYTLDEDWNVDRDLYPDFETLADDLHMLGFKFLTYNNTFITQDVDVYDEAVANGYTIKDENGEPYLFIGGKFRNATLLDLTNPDAWNWAKEIYRNGLRLGADGYMAEFAEWLPTDAVLHSGEDAVRFHNLYPVEFQRLNREVFDELYAEDGVERLFFVRSGYLGSQPLVSVFWAGDQQTDFSLGDGMPSVIPMGIGLGITGFPYYGHDIAGYMSMQTRPATRELWFRWVSLGALSPVMRTHHGKSATENWNWESDADSTAHFRRWATLHIRLFPYLYALARDAAETGVPMMRPLALEYPGFEPGWTATDQFMLGDRIIVAPVVTEGALSRTVHLPEGIFYSLDGRLTLTIPEGGREVVVDAPLTECPAFVPAGTVLSLLPDGVDTLVNADPAAGVTTLADVGEQREVWVWPGGQSALYEVSGHNLAWDAADWTGPVRNVVWNGEPAQLQGNTVTVAGNGVLTADGGATLAITGGTGDRVTMVRFLP